MSNVQSSFSSSVNSGRSNSHGAGGSGDIGADSIAASAMSHFQRSLHDSRLLVSRDTSILMRTLLGFGGWVLPALHVPTTLQKLHSAQLVALPPNDSLFLRVGTDGERRVNFFTDRTLLELWLQNTTNTTLAQLVQSDASFVLEYSAGLRAFDAVLRRLDIVECIAIDADVLLCGDALRRSLGTALRRMRIERAAAVLAATASGASDAALRYRSKTLAGTLESNQIDNASSESVILLSFIIID
jgi:hypothetical protein